MDDDATLRSRVHKRFGQYYSDLQARQDEQLAIVTKLQVHLEKVRSALLDAHSREQDAFRALIRETESTITPPEGLTDEESAGDSGAVDR